MIRTAFACLMLLLAGAAAPGADPAKVAVEMSASPTQLAVGDRVTVTLTYRWPSAWAATEPDPSADFRGVFVTDWPLPKKQRVGDEERRILTVICAATRSGAWTLPRPRFTATGFDGPVTAQAPEVILQVGTDARPAALPGKRTAWVQPPAGEARSPLVWWIGGTALALIAAGVAWIMTRRTVFAPPPTPLEIFTREWQAASISTDGKDAGARISLALRRFAGSVWRFDGPGSTTRETAQCLRGRLPDEEFSTLIRLLDRLDDLRWSPGALPIAALDRDIAAAQEWATGVQARFDAEAAAAADKRRTPDAPGVTTRPERRTGA